MGFKLYCFDYKLKCVLFELRTSLKTYENKRTTLKFYKHAKKLNLKN